MEKILGNLLDPWEVQALVQVQVQVQVRVHLIKVVAENELDEAEVDGTKVEVIVTAKITVEEIKLFKQLNN